ncbi:WHG domain-containing protein [Mycolicibacterium sp. CBMA 226]|uniref:WHG domain-containing protein n=1 Tax=Mycolicibacterium sp. CBMA 226 TaxID=2606611 RepID=UPI0012DEE7EE|nr:WHG domain-containing protein [Mycolicibacterium sp. CBMA 226]MUL78987.1 WHG domain-containing protein [Mycolicibacterium sp. CBMA 226]QGW61303.1 hypothetical protein ICEMyc226_00271 [Mycolicibacterium sp.]
MDATYATPGTPYERILKAAEAYVRFAAERPHQFRLLADPPNEPGALPGVADLVERHNDKLAAAINDGIADGTINPHLDPTTTATVLWAAMNGVLALHWRADRLRTDDTQVRGFVAAMTELVSAGLRRR